MASGSVTVKTLNGAHQASASSLCVIEGSALDGLVKSSAVVELRVRGRYWRMIQKQLQKAEEEKSRGKAPSFLIVRPNLDRLMKDEAISPVEKPCVMQCITDLQVGTLFGIAPLHPSPPRVHVVFKRHSLPGGETTFEQSFPLSKWQLESAFMQMRRIEDLVRLLKRLERCLRQLDLNRYVALPADSGADQRERQFLRESLHSALSLTPFPKALAVEKRLMQGIRSWRRLSLSPPAVTFELEPQVAPSAGGGADAGGPPGGVLVSPCWCPKGVRATVSFTVEVMDCVAVKEATHKWMDGLLCNAMRRSMILSCFFFVVLWSRILEL